MFCSQCGAKAQGNFCSSCGARLQLPAQPAAPNLEKAPPAGPANLDKPAAPLGPSGFAPPPPGMFTASPGFGPPPAGAFAFQPAPFAPPPSPIQSPTPVPADWSQEIRYDVLMRIPEVRSLLAGHAAGAGKSMSAEQFLQLCDKLALGQGVPLAAVASFAQKFNESLGIKTGKARSEDIPRPAGRVLVAALCSLAKQAQPLQKVEQAEDGCRLTAELPSSMWAMAGTLTVSVRRTLSGASVEASTHIGGQWMDWGKSKRALETLFQEIRSLA